MTALPTPPVPPTPVHKAIRRLRWFIASFKDQVAETSQETGIRYDIDEATLTAAFLVWLRAFDAQRPQSAEDRRPFVGFASGLMLKTLIRKGPATATDLPDPSDPDDPAQIWPEGYLYVAYCLNMRALVLEQEFHETQAIVPELTEARTWWSFRENVDADPALAVAFLDLFAGGAPDWAMPDVFRKNQGRRTAQAFHARLADHSGS